MPKKPSGIISLPNYDFASVTGTELLKLGRSPTRQMRIDNKDYKVTVVEGLGVLVARAGPVSRIEAFVNLFTHRFADGFLGSRASRLAKIATDAYWDDLEKAFVLDLPNLDLLGCIGDCIKSRVEIGEWARDHRMTLCADLLMKLSLKLASETEAYSHNLVDAFSKSCESWEDLHDTQKVFCKLVLVCLLQASATIEEFKRGLEEQMSTIRLMKKLSPATEEVLTLFPQFLEKDQKNRARLRESRKARYVI